MNVTQSFTASNLTPEKPQISDGVIYGRLSSNPTQVPALQFSSTCIEEKRGPHAGVSDGGVPCRELVGFPIGVTVAGVLVRGGGTPKHSHAKERDMSHLDDESRQFLAVCQQFSGEARSDVIRRETGMSRSQRDRRFTKLEDEGFILVRSADEPLNGGGIPPRIAVLTDQARRAIDDGLLDEEDDESDGEEVVRVSVTEFEDFRSRLDAMENRLNTLSQSAIHQESDAQTAVPAGGPSEVADFQQVRDDVDALQNEVTQIAELNEQMEYVYKWIGLAEPYAKASRYLFEQMGLDYEAALDDVESGDNQVDRRVHGDGMK